MTKTLVSFWVFAALSCPAFAEKSRQQYLECLKALGVEDPVYEGSKKARNQTILSRVESTRTEIEPYLNLPDFSPQAQEVLKSKGASPDFERDFTKALVEELPSLIQANSKNLEAFIKLTKEKCVGFDPSIDALLAEIEPQFENLIRLNGKVEKRVVDVVERRIGFELFHPGEGEKPFPWKDPESANLRIRGYLQAKLELARRAAGEQGGRSKPQTPGQSKSAADKTHGKAP